MSGRRARRAPPEQPAYVPGTLLDWTDSSHWDYDGPRPCRYCGDPTQLRDSHRSPAHKTCAEDALARQAAEAAEAYQQNGPPSWRTSDIAASADTPTSSTPRTAPERRSAAAPPTAASSAPSGAAGPSPHPR